MQERRGGAIASWTAFLLLGFSLGPFIGGALTHYVGWRTIFWMSAFVMLLAAAGLLPERVPFPAAPSRRHARFD